MVAHQRDHPCCESAPRGLSLYLAKLMSKVWQTRARGLAAGLLIGFAAHGNASAREAAARATEVPLERRLLFRRSTGMLINAGWTRLRYRVTDAAGSVVEHVGWGGVKHNRINERVTTHALAVLTAASRPDG